ncbi:MAG: hypothetical protein L0H84_21975 [Pseudonocardia sp.]|nr:hypothetical protein [Pseudonocardia sp.]
MAFEADHDLSLAAERHVVWFGGSERPVGGGGNTVFVRPDDERAEAAQATAVASE